VIEHRERERPRLRQTTINSYDIVLRVIERGFIRGTLTIENVPRITRGGTKGAIDQRRRNEGRDGGANRGGARGRWLHYIRVRPLLHPEVSRFVLGCAYRRWCYAGCINGCPLIGTNDRCTSFLISMI
jgi:hypothetical protein